MRHLSLVSATEVHEVHEEPEHALAGEGFRVLIVAAEVFARKRAARELARSGFTVHERSDAPSARTALACGQYDVVVADAALAIEAPRLVELAAPDLVDAVCEILWEGSEQAAHS